MTPFSASLNAWRRSTGLTHDQLAQQLGVSMRTVQSYVAGRRRPEPDILATLRRLGFSEPLPPGRGPGRPMSRNVGICDMCDETRPLDASGTCRPCRDWERAQGWHQEEVGRG